MSDELTNIDEIARYIEEELDVNSDDFLFTANEAKIILDYIKG